MITENDIITAINTVLKSQQCVYYLTHISRISTVKTSVAQQIANLKQAMRQHILNACEEEIRMVTVEVEPGYYELDEVCDAPVMHYLTEHHTPLQACIILCESCVAIPAPFQPFPVQATDYYEPLPF